MMALFVAARCSGPASSSMGASFNLFARFTLNETCWEWSRFGGVMQGDQSAAHHHFRAVLAGGMVESRPAQRDFSTQVKV